VFIFVRSGVLVAVYQANHNKIRVHNLEHAAGKHTFTMGLNEFADMTFTEFHSKMTGYKSVDRSVMRAANVEELDVPLAATVDWRTKNAVTPVKNQQQCGSCWAFSTVR
jgi:C1A family cysteine protease